MSLDAQIECVKKELKRRKKFYPIYVEEDKMLSVTAELEIHLMDSVYQTLTQLKGILSR